MHPLDPFRYLLGNAAAIRRIASDWRALIIGFLFVLTAGIARNYDHLRLTEDKEWFGGPIIMSVLSTVWIGIIAFTVLGLWKKSSFIKNARTFLILFWMTAPAAWVYALPFESFMEIGAATVANFICLLLVSIWRVALIIRSLTVLTRAPWQHALVAVVAPAAVEMWIGLWFKQLSLVNIMGGVRVLEPGEQFIKSATSMMQILCVVVFVLVIIVASMKTKSGLETQSLAPAPEIPRPGFLQILIPPILAIIFFAAASVRPQRLVYQSYALKTLFRNKQWSEFYTFLEGTKRSDYSPTSQIPPGRNYGVSELIGVIEMHDGKVPEWLIQEWEADLLAAIPHNRKYEEQRIEIDLFSKTPRGRVLAENHPNLFDPETAE